MTMYKLVEHKKADGGCGYRWLYTGKFQKVGDNHLCTCPSCNIKFPIHLSNSELEAIEKNLSEPKNRMIIRRPREWVIKEPRMKG